jgi:hypothetical protein
MELYCPRCLGTCFAWTGYSRCAFWPLGLSPRLPSLVGHLLGTYSPAIRFPFTHPRFISRPGATRASGAPSTGTLAPDLGFLEGLRSLARSLARSLLFLSPLSLFSCVRGLRFVSYSHSVCGVSVSGKPDYIFCGCVLAATAPCFIGLG